jgi:hypothetical protein
MRLRIACARVILPKNYPLYALRPKPFSPRWCNVAHAPLIYFTSARIALINVIYWRSRFWTHPERGTFFIAMRFVHRTIATLSELERKQCYSLSRRGEGTFISHLTCNCPDDRNSHIVLLKHGAELIGWAACFDRGKEGHIYVRKTERKKGHGRALINELKLVTGRNPVFFPDDGDDRWFRRKLGVRVQVS